MKKMESEVGIFRSRGEAERAIQQLVAIGVPRNRIGLLMPGSEQELQKAVPATDAEPPGIGKALGATVGGALGVAGGASTGAALASLLIPGVGPVIAGGLIGAALLGAGGAATGSKVGDLLEENLSDGLPRDQLYLYEDALRQGRSVVIAFSENEDADRRIQNVLTQAGAESVDAAEQDWWLGLRDAEAEHYKATGRDFVTDEAGYRKGFAAALHPERRGKSYDQTLRHLKDKYGDEVSGEAFRHGYERGQAYQKNVVESYKA
jgi:hypothetical protein